MAASMFRFRRLLGHVFEWKATVFSMRSTQNNSSFDRVMIYFRNTRVKQLFYHTKRITFRTPVIGSAPLGLTVICRGFLGLFEKKLDEESEADDPIVTVLREAMEETVFRNIEGANDLYHKALKMVDDKYRDGNFTEKAYILAKINVYDGMAQLSLVAGQLENAEKLYKETMKGCLQIVEETDNAIIEISVKLSSIYAMLKRNREAQLGFEHSIDVQEKKIANMAADEEADANTLGLLGLASETYGRFLMLNMKNYVKAEMHIERAVEIGRKVLGETHPQTFVLLNDLATVNILQKHYDKAEKTLTESVELAKHSESVELPALYCNLGALYLRKASYEKATIMCNQAIHFAKQFNNSAAENVANSCLKKINELKKK